MEKSEQLLAGICDLKGSQMAQMTFIKALIQALPESTHATLKEQFELQCEIAQTVLLNMAVSEQTLATMTRDLSIFRAALQEH